jgi:hypothetical protein
MDKTVFLGIAVEFGLYHHILSHHGQMGMIPNKQADE